MSQTLYIASLHRPFNQQLKTNKWVCSFIAASKIKLSSSQLNSEFYYYLIVKLNKEYQKKLPDSFNGLPSGIAINKIYDFIHEGLTKQQFLTDLPNVIKSRKTPLERQIYSTYKAASYYVNLAKDKFKLLNNSNTLTEKGKRLVKIRSGFFKISNIEAEFYFKRILEADFHLFITHCLFIKLAKKYKAKSIINEQSEFIKQYLNIKHFNFTSASLSNYNIVRNSWVESLGIVDANGNIRKKFIKILNNDKKFSLWFNELKIHLKTFEKDNFKATTTYAKRKKLFLYLYKQELVNNKSDQNFINLYDIKRNMRISFLNFQKFLQEFYESEKNNKNIFFSNTVNSIDTRERFFIRKRPVIKIKIKDK